MFRFIHRLEMRDGEEKIVLYAYTPVNYEFASELGDIKKNAINTAGKIREYVQKHFLNLNIENPTILLILNGVILGSVKLTEFLAKAKG